MKWLSLLVLFLLLSCRFPCEAATPRYYTVLRSFGFPEQSVSAEPTGDLCVGSDGRFYGQAGNGSIIFSITQTGLDYRILHRGANMVSPGAGLIEGSDGRLYGFGSGGLFSLKKDGSDFQSRTNQVGGSPVSKLLEGSDGFLYGTVGAIYSGEKDCLFRVRKNGDDFRILREFDGDGSPGGPIVNLWSSSGPVGNLLELPGGILVGAFTGKEGGIYRVNLDGSDFRVIRSANPTDSELYQMWSGLVSIDGRLYGKGYRSAVTGLPLPAFFAGRERWSFLRQ